MHTIVTHTCKPDFPFSLRLASPNQVLFQDWLRLLPTPDALNLLLFLRAVSQHDPIASLIQTDLLIEAMFLSIFSSKSFLACVLFLSDTGENMACSLFKRPPHARTSVSHLFNPPTLTLCPTLYQVDYYRGTMNRALLKSRAVQISDSFLARAAKQPLRFNDESLRQVKGRDGV
jgi:hypothetical protein